MSEFDSGNSVNCVLFYVNLYETKRENNWSPIPNTGLMSVPFPPCSLAFGSGLWYYSNGRQSAKHLDNFLWGEVPNCVIKYSIYLEYDNF